MQKSLYKQVIKQFRGDYHPLIVRRDGDILGHNIPRIFRKSYDTIIEALSRKKQPSELETSATE